MFTPWTVRGLMFVAFVVLLSVVGSHGNDETAVAKDYKLVNPYGFVGSAARQYTGRQIFDIRRNGFRVDMRVVPSLKSDSLKNDSSDGFPAFPTKDIGLCIMNFSLVCAKKRFSLFLETIKNLNEIYLMGQEIKLVKTRVLNDYASDNYTNDSIERNVNDFFDTFALRFTLPRWNGKREKNQIDLMIDETALSEGRGKGGGGGGGGGGGKGGGGKCKMMMMAGLMMLKMKVVGIATIKGMMMAGMSLMISMAMLMHKFMKGGGGYGGGGGGGHYKEIVLLTKSSGGGGGGGGCCGPSDSYGAPPPSSYGVPSGGGGYGGGGGGGYGGGGGGGYSGGGGYGGGGGGGYGGGGWGRSFSRRLITANYATKNRTADSTNSSLVIDKSPNSDSIDNSSRRDNSSMNPNVTNWNSNQYEQKYNYLNENGSIVGNGTDRKSLVHSESNNYDVDIDSHHNLAPKDYNSDSSTGGSYLNSSKRVGDTNHVNNFESNVRPVYADEWQASEDKVALTNLKRDVLDGSNLAAGQSSLRGI